MDVLVVVREEAVDGVGPAGHEPGGRVLGWRGVRLDLRLWGVRTDHVGHLVHWKEKKDFKILVSLRDSFTSYYILIELGQLLYGVR